MGPRQLDVLRYLARCDLCSPLEVGRVALGRGKKDAETLASRRLQALLRMGLVEAVSPYGTRYRRRYRITAAGRARLEEA